VVAPGDALDDLDESFSRVAVALFAPGTVDGTLREIVAQAEATVDGCDHAGVLVVADDGTAGTVAATSPLVAEIDALQIDAGEGPCLEASTRGVTTYAEDLVDDVRWPAFRDAAVAAGIRSVLAFSLSADRLSALNLYAQLPAAFGATDRAKGQLLATLARLALDSAEDRATGEALTGHLHEALRTRELIGQAQGILMERERITADQAFDVLRRASQHLNVKLHTVAEALVETGESPDTGAGSEG
jgi:ANTAR domain/GAF domain